MRHLRHLAILGLVTAAACGKNPPPETPTPEPSPAPAPTPTPTPTPTPAPAVDTEAEARALTQRLLAEIGDPVNFDFDRSDIRADQSGKLDRKAAILAVNPGVAVRIAGNADERGSDEYNLALGMRRATSAKRYLEGKGVDGSRLEVVSYGEERPLDPGKTEEAFARNRRDDFEVVRGGDRLVAPR
jgi:peptidoglycan-associated lipoprotein